MKNKKIPLLAVGMLALGAIGSMAYQTHAAQISGQITPTVSAVNSSSTTAISSNQTDTPEPGDVADTPGSAVKEHGHSPLGGDGVVSSINGSTIVIGEESDEGGASYTIDASKATVTNNGAQASLSDIKVGSKIFVEGTTSATSVVATSISIGGHRGGHGDRGNDNDGNGAKEANEAPGSTDAGE